MKRHSPTDAMRDVVGTMAARGAPQEMIARGLGITGKTLRRYYRRQLDVGAIRANAAVAESLFKATLSDGPQSLAACIFWLRARAGWRDG
jgi:hypothetical protein